MGITPAQIKKCRLTWEAPDYTSSYPAGFVDIGVAVIAVMMESVRAKGKCYTGLSAMIFISRENGDREVVETQPITECCEHSLLDSCDTVHMAMLGRAILRAWELIPEEYKQNLVTVAADRHYLKLLFREFGSLKDIMEYRSLEKVLNPYESHSLGEQHVKLVGTPAGELLPHYVEAVSYTHLTLPTSALV